MSAAGYYGNIRLPNLTRYGCPVLISTKHSIGRNVISTDKILINTIKCTHTVVCSVSLGSCGLPIVASGAFIALFHLIICCAYLARPFTGTGASKDNEYDE